MSFLAVIPLEYTCLEGETDDTVIKYFRRKTVSDENSLRYFIDIRDFVSCWSVTNNYRKMKQTIKSNIIKELISTNIRCDDHNLRSIFEEVSVVGDMISVYLSPRAMPFLINAHLCNGGFIRPLPVELLKPFRSVYAAKMFERLVRFQDTGRLMLTLHSIQDITGCKSADYSTIRRDVIKKTETELLKYDLIKNKFNIKIQKVGRKVTNIEIFFELTEAVKASPVIKYPKPENEDCYAYPVTV